MVLTQPRGCCLLWAQSSMERQQPALCGLVYPCSEPVASHVAAVPLRTPLGAPSPSPWLPAPHPALCWHVCGYGSAAANTATEPAGVVCYRGWPEKRSRCQGWHVGLCRDTEPWPQLHQPERSPVESFPYAWEKDISTCPEVRLTWCLYVPLLPSIALALPLAHFK